MTAPAVPDIWADGAGANVVTGLTLTAAQWLENTTDSRIQYGYVVYHASGSPNLSAVLPGHRLVIATGQFTNPENTGSLYIVAKDNTAKTITARTTSRLDNSLDETGATAAAKVDNSGALVQAPSASKQAQGWVTGEKPSQSQFNWLFQTVTEGVKYVMEGGAFPGYSSLATLKSETAINGIKVLLYGKGIYRFVSGDTSTADDFTVIADDANTGRYLLEIAANTWQTITGATTAVANGRYITNHAGTRVALTTPSSPVVGSEYEIANRGAAGFSLTLQPGQYLNYTATQYIYGQQLQNSDVYAAIKLLCTATDTFTIINAQGSLSFSTTGNGYSMGGMSTLTVAESAIYKLSFSAETRSTLAATLDTARGYGTGTQSTTKGYAAGGDTGSSTPSNKIDDMNFSTDASTQISATLDSARYQLGSVYSGTAGYLMGGNTGSEVNTISKLTFSGETEANIAGTLSASKAGVIGVSDTLAGYRIGGNATTSIDKLTFGTEAVTTISATLADGLTTPASIQQKGNAGYAVGGLSNAGGGTVVASAKKLTYSDETISTPAATLDTAKQLTSGCNSAVKGYTLGGYTQAGGGTVVDVIEDWAFATDTSAAIAAVLGAARLGTSGVSAFV